MSVKGDDVIIEVDHRGRDIRYPVFVDPEVNAYGDYNQGWPGWEWGQALREPRNYSVPEGYVAARNDCAYYCGLYQSHPSNTYNASGSYAHWYYRAPQNTFIYRALFGGIAHDGYDVYGRNHTDSFQGVINSAYTQYEGMQYINQSGGVGPNPFGPAEHDYWGITHDYCVSPRTCSQPTSLSEGNYALFGISTSNKFGGTGLGPAPAPYKGTTTMAHALVFLGDRRPPYLTGGLPGDRAWRDDAGGITNAAPSARDNGLGLYSFNLTGVATGSGTQRVRATNDPNNDCSGSPHFLPCPANDRDGATNFGYRLDEGANRLVLAAQDAVGNNSGTHSWTDRIDRTPPVLADVSGTLAEARNGFVGPSNDYTLNVTATDGSADSPATQRSGVTSMTATVNGQPLGNASASAACTRPEGSCPLTLNARLPRDQIAALDDSVPHTVEIKATDALGHVRTESFDFRVDAVAPDVLLEGDLVDLEGRILTQDQYSLRAEARDNAPDDPGDLADDGSEQPAEAVPPGSGLRDLVVRLDGASATTSSSSCFADPSCEQARAWDWNAGEAANGSRTIEVTAADRVGNLGVETFTVELQRAPDAPPRQIGSPRRVLGGASAGDRAGTSLASLGDVNGDQRADFAVGAPGASATGRVRAGAAYLVLGSDSTDPTDLGAPSTSTLRITGPTTNSYCGTAVAPAGDVNRDGRDDLLVGCPGLDTRLGALSTQGKVYVVFGRPDPQDVDLAALGDRGFVINGPTDSPGLVVPLAASRPAVFGERLSGGAPQRAVMDADVNGDGFADVVIGDSAVASGTAPNAGAAFVVFGKADVSPVDATALGAGGFVIRGQAANSFAGYSAVVAGDLDGDARAEVVIGAPGATAGDAGRAFVVAGRAANENVALAAAAGVTELTGDRPGDRFGVTAASVGDTNLDGREDFAIGTVSGAFVVRRLPPAGRALTTSDGFRVTGPMSLSDPLANIPEVRVAPAGDLDGDDRDDLVLGYAEDVGPRAYSVFSPEVARTVDVGNLAGQRGTSLNTGTRAERSGAAVAANGYVGRDPTVQNGQLAVGAPDATPDPTRLGAGRVYIAAERDPTTRPLFDEPDDTAQRSAQRVPSVGDLPSSYVITIPKGPGQDDWASLRSDHRQLVFANIIEGTGFTAVDAKGRRKVPYFFGYARRSGSPCGWVAGDNLPGKGTAVRRPRQCGYSIFAVNRFASLVNCDDCMDPSEIPYRDDIPVPAAIPAYRNIGPPFGRAETARNRVPNPNPNPAPTDSKFLDLSTLRADGKTRARVRVRLVSKSGRFLLVNEPSVFGDVNKWGWVESKWFFPPRSKRGLCGGATPFKSNRPRRENWPPICRPSGYNVG